MNPKQKKPLTITLRFNRVEWDIMVVATGPVASVGVNNWYQFCIIDINASKPNWVAHVTNQRTISRRRQFKHVNVIRITCSPNSNATPNSVRFRWSLSGVENLNASWANLKRCEELWILRRALSNTDDNRAGSPLAALSIVELSEHCCVSRWPRVHHLTNESSHK